jgi:hypothetical protein
MRNPPGGEQSLGRRQKDRAQQRQAIDPWGTPQQRLAAAGHGGLQAEEQHLLRHTTGS